MGRRLFIAGWKPLLTNAWGRRVSAAPKPTPGFINLPPHVHYVDDNLQELDEPLSYYCGIKDTIITIPKGTRSDGRSIPRWLPIAYAVWGGRNSPAGWLHDYLYQTNFYPRAVCDAIFREAILADKEDGAFSAWVMYMGVRVGARGVYQRYRKELERGKTSAFGADADAVDGVRGVATAGGCGPDEGQ